MRPLLAAVAALSLTLCIPQVASAQSAGATYSGRINKSISTSNAYVGEPVAITGVRTGSGTGTMYGTVTRVVRAGQGRQAQLGMNFSRLTLSNGASYSVNGVVTGMQANTKSNALKEAGGAVAGMIAGNIIGKTIFHTGMGGLIGAAGGYLLARNNKQNVTVPAGSIVQVQLRSVRRQAGHH
jgi:hypothetical protein